MRGRRKARGEGVSAPRVAGRARSRQPPTLAAFRWSLTLPLTLTLTLADLRWTGRPVAHVGQAREHGAQAVKQSQQGQDFRLGSKVEYQNAFQGGGCLARLAARTAEATKPVGTLAARGLRDAKVGAEKRAAELVL